MDIVVQKCMFYFISYLLIIEFVDTIDVFDIHTNFNYLSFITQITDDPSIKKYR